MRNQLTFFEPLKSNLKLRQKITIGIASVTVPGMLDCMNKMNKNWEGLFGGNHEHPHIIIQQPNFALIYEAHEKNDWNIVENILVDSISELEKSGADFAIIPANTAHKIIQGIQNRSKIPVINLLTEVADICKKFDFKRIGIMGTSFTMKGNLYKSTLYFRGIEEIIPDETDQKIIHTAIVDELIKFGTVSTETLGKLLSVVENLKKNGCDAIALACTELPLVLNKDNCNIPVLDTTGILAQAAVNKAYQLWSEKIMSLKINAIKSKL